MRKIVLAAGFLPEGTIRYTGQYIYRVKAFREGAHGLGPGFPQPEFLELELEGVGGIDGKLEKTTPVSSANPLDCRIHRYYLLEHDVWIKNLGEGKATAHLQPEGEPPRDPAAGAGAGRQGVGLLAVLRLSG
ncbi:MAG: hypothetical protein IKE62_01875, partial [Oscillospiraceae bacterium]|nr:hypothetical protein [Oscillospiraceae bacterium]